MVETTTRSILALSELPRVGRVKLRTILTRLTSSSSAGLPLPEMIAQLQLSEFSQDDLDSALARADVMLDACHSLGVTIHAFGSSSYPSQLKRLSEPPALLFSIGRFDPNRKPRVAVIGTRKPTPWGRKTARACAAQIADAGGVVVSGLALGIDTVAQTASVEHQGPTWAVLAHGLHTVSPSSNRELAKQIAEQGGALISEYPPGESAQRHYFVERDRIQAGLSDAVLVIESGIDGGAMHTVQFARQARVPVWVTFPNTRLNTTNARDLPEPQQGTWELLRVNTATRVRSVKALDKMVREITNSQPVPDTLFSQ
jgi:DNA processing protein